jgi:alpha-beta hydrolase superfamily lysophospholipase
MKLLKIIGASVAVLLGGLILFPEAKYTAYTPEQSYLSDSAAYIVPPMPKDWAWEYFTASDGTKIRWGETAADGGKATVLLLPGYTSSMDMYGEHMSMLAARGYHAVGLDLRGQGGSDRHRSKQPEKLYAKNFGVYSDDVAAFIAAQNWDADTPLMVLGSSFGGHVALRVVGDHKTAIAGLVLLAPAYVPNTAPFPLGLTKTITGIAKLIGKDNRYAPGQGEWRPDGTDLTVGSDCKLIKPAGTGHCLMLENDDVLNVIFDEVDALYARLTSE